MYRECLCWPRPRSPELHRSFGTGFAGNADPGQPPTVNLRTISAPPNLPKEAVAARTTAGFESRDGRAGKPDGGTAMRGTHNAVPDSHWTNRLNENPLICCPPSGDGIEPCAPYRPKRRPNKAKDCTPWLSNGTTPSRKWLPFGESAKKRCDLYSTEEMECLGGEVVRRHSSHTNVAAETGTTPG